MPVDTVVIGAGQAGLAVSRHLTDHDIEHVVLERGRVANRWRSDGWDSLRLLTPNWMSRLPGWSYRGDDPDGFMSVAELIEYLQGYADSFAPPVITDTTVSSVRLADRGYRVRTDDGVWLARNVVIATGTCGSPSVPPMATRLTAVHQLTPSTYRNPIELPDGGVLVVGASASGVQIAQELCRSGRRVVLSTGRHLRLPRSYRGLDIWWWLSQMGRLDEEAEPVTAVDPEKGRGDLSAQLVGRAGEDVDLGTLAAEGVVVAGRVVAASTHRVTLADDLEASTAAADRRLRRLLDSIDSYVARLGLESEVLDPPPYRPVTLPPAPRTLNLAAERIATVIWATGYRSSYPWLHVPVLNAFGQLRQSRGRTPAPGLYCVGLRFGQRRNSSLLDGVRHDAAAVVNHVLATRGNRGRIPTPIA
jgi:putative flavoprotein involved in K+ transport